MRFYWVLPITVYGVLLSGCGRGYSAERQSMASAGGLLEFKHWGHKDRYSKVFSDFGYESLSQGGLFVIHTETGRRKFALFSQPSEGGMARGHENQLILRNSESKTCFIVEGLLHAGYSSFYATALIDNKKDTSANGCGKWSPNETYFKATIHDDGYSGIADGLYQFIRENIAGKYVLPSATKINVEAIILSAGPLRN